MADNITLSPSVGFELSIINLAIGLTLLTVMGISNVAVSPLSSVVWKTIDEGAVLASDQALTKFVPVMSQSSQVSFSPSELVTGSRSKQFTSCSKSPGVSITEIVILISESSATGNGLEIASIVGATFEISIGTLSVTLSPSSSVTVRSIRCIPLVENECMNSECTPMFS